MSELMMVLSGIVLGWAMALIVDALYGLPQVRRLNRLQREVTANLDAVDEEIARFTDAGVVFPPSITIRRGGGE